MRRFESGSKYLRNQVLALVVLVVGLAQSAFAYDRQEVYDTGWRLDNKTNALQRVVSMSRIRPDQKLRVSQFQITVRHLWDCIQLELEPYLGVVDLMPSTDQLLCSTELQRVNYEFQWLNQDLKDSYRYSPSIYREFMETKRHLQALNSLISGYWD